jgi:hypothetical protein
LQAQVVVGGAKDVVGAVGVYEERVGVYIVTAIGAAGCNPTAGAAAALDVAVGDVGRAEGVVDFRPIRSAIAPTR